MYKITLSKFTVNVIKTVAYERTDMEGGSTAAYSGTDTHSLVNGSFKLPRALD